MAKEYLRFIHRILIGHNTLNMKQLEEHFIVILLILICKSVGYAIVNIISKVTESL